MGLHYLGTRKVCQNEKYLESSSFVVYQHTLDFRYLQTKNAVQKRTKYIIYIIKCNVSSCSPHFPFCFVTCLDDCHLPLSLFIREILVSRHRRTGRKPFFKVFFSNPLFTGLRIVAIHLLSAKMRNS